MNGFTYSFGGGVPSTTFYPSIYYPHINPLNIEDVSGSWDTLTATYVIRTVDNRTSPYDVFGLLGGTVYSTTVNDATLLSTPHWQVLVNTNFPNDSGVDSSEPSNQGPYATCSCYSHTSYPGGTKVVSCSSGSGGCNQKQGPCHGNGCTRLERIISWICNL